MSDESEGLFKGVLNFFKKAKRYLNEVLFEDEDEGSTDFRDNFSVKSLRSIQSNIKSAKSRRQSFFLKEKEKGNERELEEDTLSKISDMEKNKMILLKKEDVVSNKEILLDQVIEPRSQTKYPLNITICKAIQDSKENYVNKVRNGLKQTSFKFVKAENKPYYGLASRKLLSHEDMCESDPSIIRPIFVRRINARISNDDSLTLRSSKYTLNNRNSSKNKFLPSIKSNTTLPFLKEDFNEKLDRLSSRKKKRVLSYYPIIHEEEKVDELEERKKSKIEEEFVEINTKIQNTLRKYSRANLYKFNPSLGESLTIKPEMTFSKNDDNSEHYHRVILNRDNVLGFSDALKKAPYRSELNIATLGSENEKKPIREFKSPLMSVTQWKKRTGNIEGSQVQTSSSKGKSTFEFDKKEYLSKVKSSNAPASISVTRKQVSLAKPIVEKKENDDRVFNTEEKQKLDSLFNTEIKKRHIKDQNNQNTKRLSSDRTTSKDDSDIFMLKSSNVVEDKKVSEDRNRKKEKKSILDYLQSSVETQEEKNESILHREENSNLKLFHTNSELEKLHEPMVISPELNYKEKELNTVQIQSFHENFTKDSESEVMMISPPLNQHFKLQDNNKYKEEDYKVELEENGNKQNSFNLLQQNSTSMLPKQGFLFNQGNFNTNETFPNKQNYSDKNLFLDKFTSNSSRVSTGIFSKQESYITSNNEPEPKKVFTMGKK